MLLVELHNTYNKTKYDCSKGSNSTLPPPLILSYLSLQVRSSKPMTDPLSIIGTTHKSSFVYLFTHWLAVKAGAAKCAGIALKDTLLQTDLEEDGLFKILGEVKGELIVKFNWLPSFPISKTLGWVLVVDWQFSSFSILLPISSTGLHSK